MPASQEKTPTGDEQQGPPGLQQEVPKAHPTHLTPDGLEAVDSGHQVDGPPGRPGRTAHVVEARAVGRDEGVPQGDPRPHHRRPVRSVAEDPRT